MSTSDTRTKISEFLGPAMKQTGEFTVERVELIHTPGGNRRESLRTWHRHNEADRAFFVDGKESASAAQPPSAAQIDRLVGAILDLGEHQVETVNSTRPQRFKIIVTQANKNRTVHPFLLSLDYDGDDAEIERGDMDPTQSGVLREVMMQNRELHGRMGDLMEAAVRGMSYSNKTLAEQNERLLAEISKNYAERKDWLLRVEEAEQKKHDREMEGALVASKVQQNEFIVKEAMGLLPVIASRIVDRDDDDSKPSDKPPSDLARALGEFGAALTDDNKAWLTTNLSVQQQAMLWEVKRLAEKGGGLMLANLFHKLIGTMRESQIKGLVGGLTEAGFEAFDRARRIASAQASKADEDESDKKAG